MRRQDTDPRGRRPEAAFEDTQSMMAAQAAGAGGGRPPGDGGGRGRRGRGGRGGSGGPGGPDGPGGPGGPGGPKDPTAEDEPGRRGWKRFIPSWKIVLAGFTILTAGVFGMIAVAYANTPIPELPKDDVNDRGSVIYYRDGKTKLATIGVKRVPVEYKQIPRHVQDAVIAVENRSFREDSGIDFTGMARAVWSTVSGTQIQGASTITQQYVRGYYEGISKDISPKRKITEIFVAVKVNKKLTKEEILTRYLNTIYFGRGANGIEAAAKAFFGKHVWELSVPEAAYLAGRIQNPSRFDTLEQSGNFAATKERYEYALSGMNLMNPGAYGKYAKAPFEKLKFEEVKHSEVNKGLKGYMLDIVRRELKARGFDEERLETGGLRIVTTFDKDMMIDAKKTVNARTKGLDSTIHASVASVDPRNGRVLAFYSGDDYTQDFNNRAFDSLKQAASAFKPYVLAAWLEAGYSLDSYVDGKSTIEMPGTKPISNSGKKNFGPINMVTAMASSVNTVFVQMGEKVTLPKVAEVAKAAGVGERAKTHPSYGGKNSVDWAVDNHKYAVTIGSAAVTAVEQAAGYSIFANEGKHVKWHTVKEVKGPDGTLLAAEQKRPEQVISPESAADATFAMQAVVKGGTGTAANLGVRPVAGKTGTNNEYKDAWFVGFTPQLVTAVGMSKDVPYDRPRGEPGRKRIKVNKFGQVADPAKYDGKTIYWDEEPMPSFIGGGGTPTQIWHDYMAAVTAKDEVKQFPPKAGAGDVNNLATPKPSPTPTPTMDGDGDGWPGDGMPETPDGMRCAPGDWACETGADGGPPDIGDGGVGDGGIGDGGDGGGDGGFNTNVGGTPPAVTPKPTPSPSGRRS
ncbi:transglycosylase domain-containing protein [Planomonospora sphaerica]|uniref:transglycosylase domain-containing protein n=1 Tax=Planomonospora sphaerica TaxID=161355 RepID=UPI00083A1940|nr:transglycosylase domain-containing protein [Planomonospora sphaerica]